MEKKIKISNQEIKYQISYRNICYPRLEFKTGSLVLILPKDNKNGKEIIEKHRNWIYRKNALIKKALKDLKSKKLNIERTDKELRNFVNRVANNFSRKLEVNVNKIFFRKMRTKWGSLSPRKNLTINTLVKYLPGWLIKYIVFHEIAHLIEKKHSEKFWRIINKKYKNYQKYESFLLKCWFLIQKKMDSSPNSLISSEKMRLRKKGSD